MFNDGRGGEILARSWGARLEREGGKEKGKKGKGEGGAPPLLVKYACSSSPLCVDLLSTGLIFIVVHLVSVVIQFNVCRGTRATFNYHPTRSYCWKRGVNEAETIEWYGR